MLNYHESLPFLPEMFLENCKEKLSPADYELVLRSKLDNFEFNEEKSKILKKWIVWEINLRNELVKLRAKKLGIDSNKYLEESPEIFGLREIALESYNHSNPLIGEEILDKARWNFLDSIEACYFFELEKLIIYSLKLQLINKKIKMDKEKGEEVFNSLIIEKEEKIKIREEL